MKMPEFVWSAPVSTSLREKLFSGPYASPKMARLHAVALDTKGEVWARWAAGCTWVQDSEVAKVAANAIFAGFAKLAFEQSSLTADAQRWAMIRDTVIRLDAIARPGLPMGDDDIEQVVLRVLERTARKPVPVAPQVVAAAQAELEELHAVTRPYLILDDPEGIIGCVEATSPEAAWEAFKADNPNDYSGDPADNDVVIERVTVAWCDKLVDALEIARSELAAYRKAAGL